jgi:hypothetical protein
MERKKRTEKGKKLTDGLTGEKRSITILARLCAIFHSLFDRW